MERRFLENTDTLLTFVGKDESNGEFSWINSELGAAYIDPRLCICPWVMLVESWKKARQIFNSGYVPFYVTAAALK